MRAIETARRASTADHGVALPRPWWWALLAAVLAGLAVADLVAIHTARSGPLLDVVNTTFGHDGVRLGSAALLGAGALWALRRSFFSVMAGRPGGVEVLPFTARDDGCPTGEVATALRRELSALSLATPTPVPGESRPQGFVQSFRTATADSSTFYGAIAGVLDWLQVSTGYEVSADLETRRETPACGMTVRVRALPAGSGQRVTVWGTDWDDAARRAADVVGAHIVTRTRLCRWGPWSQWRGRRLRPELLRSYQQAQACVRARRYEEALGHYYAALELDPLNTPIRIEVCQVQEKLGLYLGALTGYVDVIVMESWKVDRRLWRRIVNDFYGKGSRPHHADYRARWGGRRGSQESLMIARYRFVCALVNGDRVIDEWRTREEAGSNDIRSREREGARRRMSSWMGVYYERFRAASPGDTDLPGDYGALMTLDRSERSPVLARLLRYVATVEADHLARDYAWFRGRRSPGMPLSETSLAVLRIWAPLHLMLVTDGKPPSTPAGDRIWERVRTTTAGTSRLDLGTLEKELRTALWWRPSPRRGWQANYNVAAAFAVLLLRRPDEESRHLVDVDADDAAARAVRYLELAVNAISPAAIVDYEQWVAVGDQDLNGLRGTPQYVSFLERIFPAADRWQQRPYDLLTFLTSTHLVLLVREFAAQQVALVQAARAEGGTVAWTFDAEAVRLLRAYSADHADWRTRLRLIRYARDRAGGAGGTFDAAFPQFATDPGLRSVPAGPSPAGLLDPQVVDRYYEELTRVRHSSWPALRRRFAVLDDAIEAVSPRGVLSPSAPEPPPEHGTAVVEMWHTVLELCDSGLRNEQDRVEDLRTELAGRVAARVDLLRQCTTDPPGSTPVPAQPVPPPAGPAGDANGSGRLARPLRVLLHPWSRVAG